jgi:capsular exopolysaccharide synthesis family protein
MDTKIPDAPEMKLHFLDYWRIIRLRKAVILLVFLLVVLTTTAITFWLPKTYSSMVRIKVDKDVPDVSGIDNKPTYAGYDPVWLQTEFEVIQSSSVLNEVIKTLNLNQKWAAKLGVSHLTTEETYPILKSQIKVNQSRNTSLIEIWVYDQNMNEAAEIANTIAEVYRESRLKQRREARDLGVDALREQLKQKQAEAQQAKAVLDQVRRTNNVDDIDTGTLTTTLLQTDTIRSLEQLRIKAASDYQQELSMLETVSKLDREQLRSSLVTIYPFDTQLANLTEKLTTAQQQFLALSKDYTPENPEYIKAKALVDKVSSQLDEKIDGILIGLKSRTDRAKADLDSAETKVETARSNYTAMANRVRPYLDAKHNLETLEKLTDALTLKIAADSIETEQPLTSIVQVVDKAVVNPRAVKPNKLLNISLGLMGGLIVGLGLAFFIEYLDTSVKTIDDVERALQAPVLGVIPQNVGHLIEEGPDTPHAEAYRVLRTNVLFSRKDQKLNTLSVLSGGAGEGKSTTLVNLATIFAQAGDRCLLVDSDLRRPSIHKIFNVSNSIGLTNYLLGQNTLEDVIQRTKVPTLDFLPSGKLPSSSMGILSSAKMKEMIAELKQRYDFVFFDSPPLLGVSDASILASEMDMCLQVIQYRRYPQPMTLRAKQMVQNVGGNLVGIVLNNINMSQDENYYYYSGYYEYSKQNDEPDVKDTKAQVTKV